MALYGKDCMNVSAILRISQINEELSVGFILPRVRLAEPHSLSRKAPAAVCAKSTDSISIRAMSLLVNVNGTAMGDCVQLSVLCHSC